MIEHLFVYGTLMPGQSRWHLLAPWVHGSPVPDNIVAELFDTGYGWPAAKIGAGEPIPGFTVRLAVQLLSTAIDALDEIEGTNRGLFARTSTMTDGIVPAWVYSWMAETDQFARINRWE